MRRLFNLNSNQFQHIQQLLGVLFWLFHKLLNLRTVFGLLASLFLQSLQDHASGWWRGATKAATLRILHRSTIKAVSRTLATTKLCNWRWKQLVILLSHCSVITEYEYKFILTCETREESKGSLWPGDPEFWMLDNGVRLPRGVQLFAGGEGHRALYSA